jgi:hypothetical protein
MVEFMQKGATIMSQNTVWELNCTIGSLYMLCFIMFHVLSILIHLLILV